MEAQRQYEEVPQQTARLPSFHAVNDIIIALITLWPLGIGQLIRLARPEELEPDDDDWKHTLVFECQECKVVARVAWWIHINADQGVSPEHFVRNASGGLHNEITLTKGDDPCGASRQQTLVCKLHHAGDKSFYIVVRAIRLYKPLSS